MLQTHSNRIFKCRKPLQPALPTHTGERNERIEQLEEDITDMKAIFHSQLETCMEQLTAATSQLGTPGSAPHGSAGAGGEGQDGQGGKEGQAVGSSGRKGHKR